MTDQLQRPRLDWTLAQVEDIYHLPLAELVGLANAVHRVHHQAKDVQLAALLSIKTGACPEDCAYCPQSVHHKGVNLEREAQLCLKVVEAAARAAKDDGASRFCMEQRGDR